jgi:L-cysteine:1D-myo-inositol 2-amino-2-deoxy-alpha-D-glucopyranoside ligase
VPPVSSRTSIRLYDTARREIVAFEPPPTVRMYVCGITPYDSTHLGHAATFLTYDLLIRRLE